jgi:hypothetical protein
VSNVRKDASIDVVACFFGMANPRLRENVVATKRKIIVHIATSADGYIARPDGDLEWLDISP